jgi:IMP dehydrogenase
MVAPALQSEGKQLQREQEVGMGATSAAVPHPGADGAMDSIPTQAADPALVE